MPNTSVHLPDGLAERLDREAERRRVPRNRLIVEACERIVEEGGGSWPVGFFVKKHVSKETADGFEVFVGAIQSARRSRR